VLRYRPLTPLFLAMVIVERGLMSLQGWILKPPANGHHPPEHSERSERNGAAVADPDFAVPPSAPAPRAPDPLTLARSRLDKMRGIH
jgi:hypothetical protein